MMRRPEVTLSRRARTLFWLALTVEIAAVAFWEAVPLPDAGARIAALSAPVSGCRMRAVPETDTEKAVYGDARIVKRAVFLNHSGAFLVTVIDGSRNRHAIHDPLYCLRGAGWEVTAQESVPLTGGAARWLRLARAGRSTETVYWFSDGRTRYDSATRYWAQTALRRITLGRSGQEPVLIVLEPLGGTMPDWFGVLTDFEPWEQL